jgi:hypothetical protein
MLAAKQFTELRFIKMPEVFRTFICVLCVGFVLVFLLIGDCFCMDTLFTCAGLLYE